MKTKVDSATALRPTRDGLTASNWARSIQRIRKDRQNSSSITGTSSAAPAQRTATSGHCSWPCESTGRNDAVASPSFIHGASSEIQSQNTSAPTATPSSSSFASGNSWADSSPYSRRKRHNSAPTSTTIQP